MSDVTDRIEKLLRVSQDPAATAAEAANAMEKATRLAREHAVNLGSIDVSGDSVSDVSISHSILKTKATGDAEKFVAELIQSYFFVKIIFGSGSVYFVGAKHHCQLAEHYFAFLVASFRGCWDVARRKDRRLSRRPFLSGMQTAVHSTLHGLYPEAGKSESYSTALAVSFDAYVANNFGSTSRVSVKRPTRPTRSECEGYFAGKSVDINQPVEGGGAREQLA